MAAKLANPFYDITDIAFDVVVAYELPSLPNKVITDVLVGCEFKEAAHKMGQGDMSVMVTLPIIYLRQYSK